MMPSKTDIQLSHLADEIEATQLVLVAYLTGIAEASPGGRRHIETVFRMADKLAESAAELLGRDQPADRARRVQKAVEDLKDLTL
jgi:hypothetical protein